MTTMTNGGVLAALLALSEIINPQLDESGKAIRKEFPARGSFNIRELRKELEGKWKIAEEVREALIEQYAERDEAGKPVAGDLVNGQPSTKLQDPDAFNKAWQDLLATEVGIQKTISLSDFGDEKISVATMIALGDLLVA